MLFLVEEKLMQFSLSPNSMLIFFFCSIYYSLCRNTLCYSHNKSKAKLLNLLCVWNIKHVIKIMTKPHHVPTDLNQQSLTFDYFSAFSSPRHNHHGWLAITKQFLCLLFSSLQNSTTTTTTAKQDSTAINLQTKRFAMWPCPSSLSSWCNFTSLYTVHGRHSQAVPTTSLDIDVQSTHRSNYMYACAVMHMSRKVHAGQRGRLRRRPGVGFHAWMFFCLVFC